MSFLYAVKYKQHTRCDRECLKIEHLDQLSRLMWRFIIALFFRLNEITEEAVGGSKYGENKKLIQNCITSIQSFQKNK
jgi:hypothetical protein